VRAISLRMKFVVPLTIPWMRSMCAAASDSCSTRITGTTPATGAYGHAMASNYNGIPRPPVIFCKDGDARVVVRRETYDDLAARDVD
jgi:hypothetical protein